MTTAIGGPSVERLRQAFGQFPSGVTALCGMVDGTPNGLAANSFTSVSLDPALVLVCMAHSSRTWPVLRELPRLGLSVLGEDHDAVCRGLAARGVDRFAGVSWSTTEHGAVFIDEAPLWLECSVEREFVAGDHQIVLLRVVWLEARPGLAPLVFHSSRFRRLR